MTKQTAAIIAATALAFGLLGAGVFKTVHDDPCRKAFDLADQALVLSADVMNASTRSTIAIRDEDVTAARSASDDIHTAVTKLGSLQPEYDKAELACRKK